MLFKVGDRIVHHQHGLGQVTRLAMKQFGTGKKSPFYEVSFPGSTLWVPLSLADSGIRKLSTKTEIASCRSVLKAPAEFLGDNFRLRQIELNDRIKEGTITAHCEIVRDLIAHGWHKPLRGSVVTFLRGIQEALYQEWATVEEITLAEAAIEIQFLLEKGRQLNDNK
jgi:CarD family transcriptional regulator